MDTILVNEWITLSETRKGAPVQRKYAGINTLCDNKTNKVLFCIISYWERELYPNGEENKIFLKTYTLTDLERQEWQEEAGLVNVGTEEDPIMEMSYDTKYRNELLVLSGFVASLGNNYIIAPTRSTIQNLAVLPLDKEEGYPLHRDTRTIQTQ